MGASICCATIVCLPLLYLLLRRINNKIPKREAGPTTMRNINEIPDQSEFNKNQQENNFPPPKPINIDIEEASNEPI